MKLYSTLNGISAGIFCLAALLAQPASACGYHGSVNNPFTFSYPGSVQLAVNTRQALDDQVLGALFPMPGSFALKRSAGWVERLASQMGQHSENAEFHILVMNSGLWTSVTRQGGETVVSIHVERPDNPGAVLLVSEEALSALVNGKLDGNTALNQQLVMFDGGETGKIRQALQKAYPLNRKTGLVQSAPIHDSLSMVRN